MGIFGFECLQSYTEERFASSTGLDVACLKCSYVSVRLCLHACVPQCYETDEGKFTRTAVTKRSAHYACCWCARWHSHFPLPIIRRLFSQILQVFQGMKMFTLTYRGHKTRESGKIKGTMKDKAWLPRQPITWMVREIGQEETTQSLPWFSIGIFRACFQFARNFQTQLSRANDPRPEAGVDVSHLTH